MTKRGQFILIFISSVALASLASHAAVRIFGFETQAIRNHEFDADFHSKPVLVMGSSLIGYGFDWDLIGKKFSRRVDLISSPAASPCELEVLQAQIPETDFTVVGVSVSDLNEDSLSEYRADIVPFTQTCRDLWNSHADGDLARRTLGIYPLRYVRFLFPMAGRSVGFLVGVRKMAQQLMHHGNSAASEPVPTMNASGGAPTNRLADWPNGRLLRNLEERRVDCGGKCSFTGPKHLALERVLRNAAARGQLLVAVIPDSPYYQQNMFTPMTARAFEASLAEMATRVPEAKWIRIDQIPELQSNDMYWDLAHLNVYGRTIATAAMLKQLAPILSAP